MTLFCPAHIEFLLWCHTRSEPYPNVTLDMFRDLIQQFMDADVIEPTAVHMHFKTTKKGAAWVKMLCDLEEPRVAFVDGQGKVIEL